MAGKKKSIDRRLRDWERLFLNYRLKRKGFAPLPMPENLPRSFAKRRSGLALYRLLQDFEFETVLDVGSGAGEYAELMEHEGKVVDRFDFGKSRAFDAASQSDRTILGDFLTHEFVDLYDCVWASHVLEHTPHPQTFLNKMRNVCKPDGWLAITVPPAKGELVGGHLTLWTQGLLLYHLVLAGIDCSDAIVMRYGYSITVIVRNRAHDCDLSGLAWDLNDIARLSDALPDKVDIRCNGDLIGDVYEGAEINFLR